MDAGQANSEAMGAAVNFTALMVTVTDQP